MKTKLTVVILLIGFVLRVVGLNSVPPSMYWEEVALGYDAFSIYKTGKDHHGNAFPIVSFESFGDYKPSLYFYSIIPFLPIFGLTVWSVRLPSVFAGVIIILCTGKIAGLLFAQKHSQKKRTFLENLLDPEILTMIAVSISPWALQFSRSGWEVNLATSLLTVGMYFGIKGALAIFQKKSEKLIYKNYLTAVIFLVLSTYAYHAMRVISPLLGICLVLPLLKDFKKYHKQVLGLGVTGVLLMAPILLSIKDPTVTHRLQETSTFSEGKEVLMSNEYIQRFGSNILAKLVFHRFWFYLRTVAMNALAHLDLSYLFLSGDKITRHSVQYFGLFFPTDFFLIGAGVVKIFKNWRNRFSILIAWFIIGLIPASLSQPVPHALRTLAMMPVYMMLLALGAKAIMFALSGQKLFKLLTTSILLVYLGQLFMFWHYYVLVYPKISNADWQYGYQQMIETVKKEQRNDEKMYITREYGRPAMYYWFFTQTDPKVVQNQNSTAQKDQSEFLTFNNVNFYRGSLSGQEKGLIVSTPEMRKSYGGGTDIATIKGLRGEPFWVIFRVE